MGKRFFCIVLVIFMAALMAGCWSRNEIEDLGIVSILGIDRVRVDETAKYRVSALVLRPPQLGGGQQQPSAEKNPEWLVSEVGNSLFDATRNISRRTPRIPVLYHNTAIIISEKVARQGVEDVIDYLQRHKDIRLRNWIFVSPVDARTIMGALPEVEQTLTMELTEILTTSNPKISETLGVDLNHFTQNLVDTGQDPVLPVVTIMSPKEIAGNQRGQKEPSETIELHGLAVFKGQKLVGFLTPAETKGFLYIVGKAQSGIIPVDIEGKGKVSFMMRRSSTEFKPTIKNGKMVMEIVIKAEADVVEVEGDLKVGDPEVLKDLEKELSKAVRTLAYDTLYLGQKKYKSDIFGFGRHIHIYYPEYWHDIEKDWYDLYPELPVSLKVEGKLRRTVNISDPMEIK